LITTSFTGSNILAYINYSDLQSIAESGDSVGVTLKVYYDTGVEGFLIDDGNGSYYYGPNTQKYVAIREAHPDNYGQYITLDATETSLRNRNLNFEEVRAEGSIYRMTAANTGNASGAQALNIADTLVSTDVLKGKVDLTFAHYKYNNLFGYVAGSNASARLGGAYDGKLTLNTLPFTVSKITTSTKVSPNSGGSYETFKLGSIVPRVNLHSGAAYTIVPSVNAASVTFKLSGAKGAKDAFYGYDSGNNKYGNVYMLLYRVVGSTYEKINDENGKQRRFVQVLDKNNISGAPGDGTYTVLIDGLEPDSTYAVQLVYYKNPTDYTNYTNPVFLIDEENPLKAPSRVYYPIYTASSITIPEAEVRAKYRAVTYNEKYVDVSFNLSSTSSALKGDETFAYALYDNLGNVVLTHNELLNNNYLYKGTGTGISLEFAPQTTIVGYDENATGDKNIYLNYDSSAQGYVRNYRLRIFPMKTNAINTFTGTEAASFATTSHTHHTQTFTDDYNTWINTVSLGRDKDGVHAYAGFNKLKAKPSSPYYNIRSYSMQKAVMFRISIVDVAGVLLNNNYMIRAFNGSGTDITPDSYENQILTAGSTNTVTIAGLGDNEAVTLKVYAVEDYKNINIPDTIFSYKSHFGNITEENDDVAHGKYVIVSDTQRSTTSSGFSVGSIEVIGTGTYGEAVLDFVNPSNIGYVSNMHIDILAPDGSVTQLDDQENPFDNSAQDSGISEVVVQEGDTRYRFKRLTTPFSFNKAGQYTVSIRLTITDNNNAVTMQDHTVTYYVYS